jgi:brefeldin A-inhibited guanine nucleotide-exchange protein
MAQPRIFSLQKLVEVADCNMPVRGRIIWANIWRLLANHFTIVACGEDGGYKPNTAVSLYAVDSLRQLSLKFLSKDEMAGFNFQRMFLEPFAIIMQQNSSTEVVHMHNFKVHTYFALSPPFFSNII